MQLHKKTILRLAVNGILYGLFLPAAASATDNIISESVKDKVYDSLREDDTVVINKDVTVSSSIATETALTIDTRDDSNNNPSPVLNLNVTNNGTITGVNALNTLGGSSLNFNNNGYFRGLISGDGTITLNNKGTAYFRMNNPPAMNITNSGLFIAYNGTNLGNGYLNTENGTLMISFEDSSSASGLTTTGNVFVNDASVIKVSASPAILKAGIQSVQNVALVTGNMEFIAEGQSSATPIDDLNAPTQGSFKVEGGNILVKVSNVQITSTGVTADIAANDIKAITSTLGYADYIQSIADSLQKGTISASELSRLTTSYGDLVTNADSNEALIQYLNRVRPDDTNSAAEAGAEMAHAVAGNISARSATVRTGLNYGSMMAADGFWFQAIKSESKRKKDGVSLGFNGTLSGGSIGYDRLFDNMTAGLAFSFGNSSTSFVERNQQEDVKSYIGSLYSTWQWNNLYIDSSFSFGLSTHTSTLDAGSAKAEYQSTQLGAVTNIGYYFNLGRAVLEPIVSGRYTHINLDAYQYSADNRSDADNLTRFELGAGLALSTSFKAKDSGVFTPRANIHYYRDTVNETLEKDVIFGGNRYTLKGPSPERNSWEAGLGVDFTSDSNVSVSGSYTHVKKNKFSSDSYNVKIRYEF